MIRFRFFFVLAVMLAVMLCQSSLAAEKVLEMNSQGWKYLDTKEAPGKDWIKAEFDDSKWESGQAPLGYGDDDIKQKVSFGDDADNKNLCVFFRRIIEIKDPATAKQFHGQLICDDGCAIYVNGEEVHRHNLPPGELTTKTMALFAIGGEPERHKFNLLIDPAKLKAGKNIIAARVHQGGNNSSDLAFDLSLVPLTSDDQVTEAKQATKLEKEAIEQTIAEQGGNQ